MKNCQARQNATVASCNAQSPWTTCKNRRWIYTVKVQDCWRPNIWIVQGRYQYFKHLIQLRKPQLSEFLMKKSQRIPKTFFLVRPCKVQAKKRNNFDMGARINWKNIKKHIMKRQSLNNKHKLKHKKHKWQTWKWTYTNSSGN